MPPAPASGTLAESIAAQVAALAADGLGRNEIARRLDVSMGTVTNAARLAGVEFDRAATAAATAASAADAKTRRQSLSLRFLDVAERLLDALDPAAEDARDVRARVLAAGSAVATHLRIDAHDSQTGRDLSAVDAWLDEIAGEKAGEYGDEETAA